MEGSSPPRPMGDRRPCEECKQLHICQQCKYYRTNPGIELFSPSDQNDPGVLRARIEYEQLQSQVRFQEYQMQEGKIAFDHEPLFYPWCDYFSRTNITNYVTGEISKLYILCVWENEDGFCRKFHE